MDKVVRQMILKNSYWEGPHPIPLFTYEERCHKEELWTKLPFSKTLLLGLTKPQIMPSPGELSTEVIIPGVHRVRLWCEYEIICLIQGPESHLGLPEVCLRSMEMTELIQFFNGLQTTYVQ